MALTFDTSNILKNVAVATEYFKAYYAIQYQNTSSNDDGSNPTQKFSGGTNGFIPFNIDFTVDGISGIKIYNKLTINTSFLPNGYTRTTDFIITGVDHKLIDHDWVTNIKTTLIPKFQDSDKVITAQNFASLKFLNQPKPIILTPPLSPDNNPPGITPTFIPNDGDITKADRETYHWSLIPDGMNSNYRSKQIKLKDLERFLTQYNIKRIVRMNGDDDDSGGVQQSEEKAIAEKLGIKWVFINAHRAAPGLSKLEHGYQESRSLINEQMANGNTWVHCRRGADRTGMAVASFIQSRNVNNNGFTLEYENGSIPSTGKPWTYEELMDYSYLFNGWKTMKDFESNGYRFYANTFYPQSKRNTARKK
jgi:protein tyrosine phosphatase (PTP) superfamily phosphohydrolase (DUF442 family)